MGAGSAGPPVLQAFKTTTTNLAWHVPVSTRGGTGRSGPQTPRRWEPDATRHGKGTPHRWTPGGGSWLIFHRRRAASPVAARRSIISAAAQLAGAAPSQRSSGWFRSSVAQPEAAPNRPPGPCAGTIRSCIRRIGARPGLPVKTIGTRCQRSCPPEVSSARWYRRQKSRPTTWPGRRTANRRRARAAPRRSVRAAPRRPAGRTASGWR